VIAFNKNKNFIFEITNKSSEKYLAFKIKITTTKTYEVKPAMGSINPL
jgi:hypothetical protein